MYANAYLCKCIYTNMHTHVCMHIGKMYMYACVCVHLHIYA